jgi:RNA polymerase sigma factor (sigma-70 family)
MMSRVEGKTYREIGEILGVSERTIEKRISKVIQRLKKELKET